MLSRLVGVLSTNPPGEVEDPDCNELVQAYLRTFRSLQTCDCPISCGHLSARLVRIVQIYNKFCELVEAADTEENHVQAMTDDQIECRRTNNVRVQEGRRIVRSYLLQIS